MPTVMIYNGVTLYNCLTRNFEQDVERDESGADVLFTRFRMEFECTIHIQATVDFSTNQVYVTTPPGGAVSTATEAYRLIRAALWEPRKELTVFVGGELMFRAIYVADGKDVDADVDNGPKPRGVTITHICGDVYRVRFSIECAKVECLNGDSPYPQGVLSNRWSITETMDENFFITRAIRGKLRISQAMGQQLHALRPAIVPTLERNFRRVSIEFAALPNGLEADYAVVDRQVATAAPWPATKMAARFEESTDQALNAFSEIRVRLEGMPNADKRLLMARAVQVAETRLGPFNEMTSDNVLIEQISFAEEIGDSNVVDFLCRLRRTNLSAGSSFIGNIDASTFGLPLKLPATPTSYDASQSVAPAAWGYNPADPQGTPRKPNVVLFALRCYLQSPCEIQHRIQQPQAGSAGTTPDYISPANDTAVTTTQVSQLPAWTGQPKLSAAAKNSLFTFAHMTSQYVLKKNRVQIPKSGGSGNPGDPASTFVTLGRAQCRRLITVDAERVGSPPKMPAPLDSYTEGSGNVAKLLEHQVTPMPPSLSPDGTKLIYRVQAMYVYGLTRAPQPGETLLTGVLPFVNMAPGASQVTYSDLYDSKLGPALS